MLACPIHKTPFKTVPAGTTKLGKPYPSFRACSTFGCRIKEEEGIEVADPVYQGGPEKFDPPGSVPPAKTEKSNEMSKQDWQDKDDRIGRLTLAKTALNAGFNWQQAKDNDIQKYWVWVKTGYDPDKVTEKEIKEYTDDLTLGE